MGTTKLIEKVKQNDQAAFEELYNEYYPMGFSLALQFVKNEEEAMDIMQDAFITVCTKLDSLQDTNKFKSWYMQIVANKCRDFLKKKNPLSFTDANAYDEDGNLQFDIEDDDREFQPEESVDYTETVRIVNKMLDELPEDQKMCLLLYYVNGLKISEIAESLGISEATVKSRLKYGKEKLKVQVENYEKNTGTKLHSFAGFAIIPFIRWMFNKTNRNIAPKTDILEQCLETLTNKSDKILGKGNFNMNTDNMTNEVVENIADKTNSKFNISKIVEKFNSLNTVQKVVSLVAAGAIAIGGIAGVSSIANKNNGGSHNGGIFAPKHEKVYLDEYITVSFNGTDGYGEGYYRVDSEGLVDIVKKPVIDEYLIKVAGEEGRTAAVWGEYSSLAELLAFEFDKSKNLSNGDEVTLNVSLTGDLDYYGETLESLKDYFKIDFETSFSYTVADLPEYKEVDIYGMVKDYIVYEGASGNARADFEFPENYQQVLADKVYLNFLSSNINFVIDNSSIGTIPLSLDGGPLSNGEIVSIKLNDYSLENINSELHKFGYSIEKIKYSHTVSGLGEYVNSKEQLTEESINNFYNRMYDAINTENSIGKTYTPLSMYLLTLKDGVINQYSSKCKIYLVYKVHTPRGDWWDESVSYYYADCTDIYVDKENVLHGKYSNGFLRGSYKSEKEAIEKFETHGYTIEKIK